MKLEPKIAINYRSEEEREMIRKVAKESGINTSGLCEYNSGRAYICPEGYRGRTGCRIEDWDKVDAECEADKSDPFEWTYVEAANIFRNLLIAERRKHAT